MEDPTKMTRGEPKGLSQAMVYGRWREVGESSEVPHRLKWTPLESGGDAFIGVFDGFSIVGIGSFLGPKEKCASRR
jgi:hypothetical protein